MLSDHLQFLTCFNEGGDGMIKMVLMNLLDEAIKYGRDGSCTKVSFYNMDENFITETLE